MTTNISIMDDGYNVVSQPVMGVYALYQQPAPAAPLGTAEPEVEDDEASVEAKVVKSPGKAAPKAAATAGAVVTK